LGAEHVPPPEEDPGTPGFNELIVTGNVEPGIKAIF